PRRRRAYQPSTILPALSLGPAVILTPSARRREEGTILASPPAHAASPPGWSDLGCSRLSRRPPVQLGTVHTERHVDVAPRGVRVRAALVGSTHQVLGVGARQTGQLEVEGDRQAEAPVTGGTASPPRGDLRTGG